MRMLEFLFDSRPGVMLNPLSPSMRERRAGRRGSLRCGLSGPGGVEQAWHMSEEEGLGDGGEGARQFSQQEGIGMRMGAKERRMKVRGRDRAGYDGGDDDESV